MSVSRLHRWALAVTTGFLLLLTGTADAQSPADKVANKKIDEAVNRHYLATQFDRAEKLLSATIRACARKCSPEVVARAWMYVGIVRGSGRSDLEGAEEAFLEAVKLHPEIELDAEIATADTAKAFEGVAAAFRAPQPEPEPKAATSIPERMECTPVQQEIPLNYPVPISCSTESGALKAEAFFAVATEPWRAIAMKKRQGRFEAELPCGATRLAGRIRLYVIARDADGHGVDSWGSEAKPIELFKSQSPGVAPASFPERGAPDSCLPKKPVSAAGEDCTGGDCAERRGSNRDYERNWLGVHVAQDLAFVGGNDVCTPDSQRNSGFTCYYEGTERRYTGLPEGDIGNNINSGFVLATRRLLVSYSRALTPQFMFGVRGGFAIGGGPPTITGRKFLPGHAEIRGIFFPLENALAEKGMRPFVHVGGGMGQVDAKVEVNAIDCSTVVEGGSVIANSDPEEEQECVAGDSDSDRHPRLRLDTYKQLGQGFVSLGGGAVFAVTRALGFELALNGLFMLPTTGIVIQPSAGFVFGL